MHTAPIVLFVYNRPDHTRKTLQALQRNELAASSELFVFADGPKPGADAEALKKIAEVRTIIREQQWCGKQTIRESDTNKGLSVSILNGVTEVISKYQRVIVLEDDMITSPRFLNFMNSALELYEPQENVACISAYFYPLTEPAPAAFFIKGADCWGWATWKRAWDTFERDGQKLLWELEHKKLEKEFDFENTYPYIRMLKDQITGKNDSWAIRWYASAFLAGQLTLYPGKSMLRNTGSDGSGSHGGVTDNWDTEIAQQEPKLPNVIAEEDADVRQKMIRYFKSIRIYRVQKMTLLRRIIRRIKKYLPK
ncbi:MAG TPA: glycosyltransferase family 2 protein [Bacteroidia bacterium]|jgi:hypothetical protein|nr:glycosyltransferase family 2 protein [Bacteroidia bacterium]